jgi:hypothetical protein
MMSRTVGGLVYPINAIEKTGEALTAFIVAYTQKW